MYKKRAMKRSEAIALMKQTRPFASKEIGEMIDAAESTGFANGTFNVIQKAILSDSVMYLRLINNGIAFPTSIDRRTEKWK